MECREYVPAACLASVVACFWTLEGDAHENDGAAQPVLPDGRADPEHDFPKIIRYTARERSWIFARQTTVVP